MNRLQPREEFQSADDKRADVHQEIVLSPRFKEACEVALLEYVMGLSTSSLQTAAETAYKIEGAKGVLAVLLNLGDQSKPLIERRNDALTPV
jgi:hypothetical protein